MSPSAAHTAAMPSLALRPSPVTNRTACAATATSDGSRVWLPEILCRVARYLPPNDVAACLRLADRCAAATLRAPRHTTIRLSQPVHPAAFAKHWACSQGGSAAHALTRNQRLLLLKLVLRSGALANVQLLCSHPAISEGFPITQLGEDDLVGAAAAGHGACVRWLLDVARVMCGPHALEAACRRGRLEVVIELLASGVKGAWSDAAAGAAAEGGHLGLTLWLLNARPTQVDVARLLEGAAAGLDAATLERLHRVWAPPRAPLPCARGGRALPADMLADALPAMRFAAQPENQMRCGLTYQERMWILAAAAGSPTPDWVQKMVLLKEMWGGEVPRDPAVCAAAASVRARALSVALNRSGAGSAGGAASVGSVDGVDDAAAGLRSWGLERGAAEQPDAVPQGPLAELPSAWPRLQWLMRKGFPLHAVQALDAAASAGDAEAVRGLLSHPRVRQVLSALGSAYIMGVLQSVLSRGVDRWLARAKRGDLLGQDPEVWRDADGGVRCCSGLPPRRRRQGMIPVLAAILDACGVGAEAPPAAAATAAASAAGAVGIPTGVAARNGTQAVRMQQPAAARAARPPPAALAPLPVPDPYELVYLVLSTGSLELCDWVYARCFGSGSGSSGSSSSSSSSSSSGSSQPLAQLPRMLRFNLVREALACAAWVQPSLPLLLWLEAHGVNAMDPGDPAVALPAVFGPVARSMTAFAAAYPVFELQKGVALLQLPLQRGDLEAAAHLVLQRLGPEVEAALGSWKVWGACLLWWAAEGGSRSMLDWVAARHPPHEVWSLSRHSRSRGGERRRLQQLLLPAADECYVAAARNGDVATLRALRAKGCPWRPCWFLFTRIVAPGIAPLEVFTHSGEAGQQLPRGCNPDALAAATNTRGQASQAAAGRNCCTVAVLQWLLEPAQGPCPADWDAAYEGAWHWAGSNSLGTLEWIAERRDAAKRQQEALPAGVQLL